MIPLKVEIDSPIITLLLLQAPPPHHLHLQMGRSKMTPALSEFILYRICSLCCVLASNLLFRAKWIFIFCCSHLADKSTRWEDPSGRGSSGSGEGHHGNGSGPSIPSLLSMPTRSHMDITTPPLPQVCAEVLRVAEHRHRRGLMYPQIYHILTKVQQPHSIPNVSCCWICNGTGDSFFYAFKFSIFTWVIYLG